MTTKILNKDIKLFKVKGIDLIGNPNNGVVIGLKSSAAEMIFNMLQGNTEYYSMLQKHHPELETALIQNGFFDFSPERKLQSAYIHFNSRCNLHCYGCYSYLENRNTVAELPTEFWLEKIEELYDCGLRKVIISGGEPFLREDLHILCAHMKKLGIYVNVITNGTLPFDVYNAVLPFLDSITVSVDGYDENTSFIRDKGIMPTVLKTIKYLKTKINISMVVTLHKKNVNDMKKYKVIQ